MANLDAAELQQEQWTNVFRQFLSSIEAELSAAFDLKRLLSSTKADHDFSVHNCQQILQQLTANPHATSVDDEMAKMFDQFIVQAKRTVATAIAHLSRIQMQTNGVIEKLNFSEQEVCDMPHMRIIDANMKMFRYNDK